MSDVVAIVNPVAGRKRGAELRTVALTELRRLFPDLAVVESAAPGHATELARQAAGAVLVIAVGGDGTVREVASGLVSTDGVLECSSPRPVLAVIPVGSGNDLLKTIGVPTDIPAACRIAKEGAPRPLDVVQVEMGREVTHFVNAAGFGFDASVVAASRKYKRLRGMPLYLFAVLDAVRSYHCPRVHIAARDFTNEQAILLVAAANGRYYGGGMKVAPDARPDDGLLEICVGDSMGRLSILRKLPRFVAGTHVTLKDVRMLKSPWLDLEFLDQVHVQLDGDFQEPQPHRHFRLRVLPSAVRIQTPASR
jgi:YegS/Rv2252/BmrU family lipid kinase